MTSIVDRYYRRIAQNIDNITMKFDISALLVKCKEHDSKIDTNKENISKNLTLINSKSDIIETSKNNISENLTLINSNENRLDDIENNIVNINTKVTNNYNISQINENNIDFKTNIIDNHITAINSTLTNIQNDLKTKNNNSKYSIENFFIYNIEIENNYSLNEDNPRCSISNCTLVDNFQNYAILEVNCKLLYDYTTYDNIGTLMHIFRLYDGGNILFYEYRSIKTNAGDNKADF